MSTLPHRNETKTADLKLVIFNIKNGIVDHVLCGHYDIMFLIGGEGPHLSATGRQAMNSVQTNKVVFCQGHMYEH